MDKVVSDFRISGDGSDDSFGNDGTVVRGRDPEGGELSETEGWGPLRGEHDRDSAIRFNDSGAPLIKVSDASVSGLAFAEASIM